MPNISQVVANPEKDRLVADILEIPARMLQRWNQSSACLCQDRASARAFFIKAQDGCNNRCTFCITTLARGRARSRTIPQILADIHSAGGTNEIVLTGVHLGSWGQDFSNPSSLKDLLKAILGETDVARIRLSSLEPWDLELDFFELWENPRLCPHLHLPLQSGCAATLHRMARKTTPIAFAALIETARRAIPEVALTTDLIAGFPGETELEFQESLDFVRQMKFAGGHVFSYSPREGTAAAQMPAQVPPAIRKRRGAVLKDVLSTASQNYQQSFIGRVLPVLWESAADQGAQGRTVSGLTGNYMRVHAHSDQAVCNRITPVLLSEIGPDGLCGQILPNHAEIGK